MRRTRAERRRARAQDFWSEFRDAPIIERSDRSDERIVTFLWQDAAAAEVLLFANKLTDERDIASSLMRRLRGTDIWHLSYRMRADWRASYGFLTRDRGDAWPWGDGDHASIRRALDHSRADPRNPRSIPNRPGTPLSLVELPDAPRQPWAEHRPDLGSRGALDERRGPDGRPVWVYVPAPSAVAAASPGAVSAALPVVVILDGDAWVRHHRISATLDNLIADGQIRPCLVLLPDSGGSERRWEELDARGDGARWIVERLLPWARGRFPVSADPAETIVAGQSLGGYTALRAAFEYPSVVGGVISQSASLWQQGLADPASIPGTVRGLRMYLEVGAHEWVLREPNRRLADAVAAAGGDIRYTEYNGGHDYACWRGGLADGLRVLLGPAAPPRRLDTRLETNRGGQRV
nr:enterochelin esterase [Leucobacter weissii]